jgi:ankyrin repeat protein
MAGVRLTPRALEKAVLAGDLAAVRTLIAKGADVNRLTDGQTALSWAVYHERDEIAKALLAAGADPNRGSGYPAAGAALHAAAASKNPDMVRLLLAHGAIADHPGDVGCGALLTAITHDAPVEVLEVLLDAGANPNLVDRQGDSPLSATAELRRLEYLKLLLARGGDPSTQHGSGHRYVLHIAAAKGRVPVAEALLDAGASLEAQNADGWTALHTAARWNRHEMCQFLLTRGANRDARTTGDETPREIAEAHAASRAIDALAGC